jgi:hypothetical protein
MPRRQDRVSRGRGWSPYFCLSCDKQTDGNVYCSEACRVADFEKTSSNTALPATSSIPSHGSLPPVDSPTSFLPQLGENRQSSDDGIPKERRRWKTTSSKEWPTADGPETSQEPMRREKALHGVSKVSESQPSKEIPRHEQNDHSTEAQAEGRKRKSWEGAALDMGNEVAKGIAAPDNLNYGEEDDHPIRFTVGGAGRRLKKQEFIRDIQLLDAGVRPGMVARQNESRLNAQMPTTSATRLANTFADGSYITTKSRKNVDVHQGKGVYDFASVRTKHSSSIYTHMTSAVEKNNPGSWHEWEHLLETQGQAGEQSTSFSDTRKTYEEGDHFIVENEDGEVIDVRAKSNPKESTRVADACVKPPERLSRYKSLQKKFGVWRQRGGSEGEPSEQSNKNSAPALAYQFGNPVRFLIRSIVSLLIES